MSKEKAALYAKILSNEFSQYDLDELIIKQDKEYGLCALLNYAKFSKMIATVKLLHERAYTHVKKAEHV